MTPVSALALTVLALRRRRDAVVLVDGRSGSGKTTFAAAVAACARVELLRLEDLYPGWDGLAAASRSLEHVLERRAAGAPGAVRTWDWSRGRPGPTRFLLPRGGLVVEGCGSLSRRGAAVADLSVWVQLPEPERRARALRRDGDSYAPHWDRWARQERAFSAREDPRRCADLEVDGRHFPQPLFSGYAGDVH